MTEFVNMLNELVDESDLTKAADNIKAAWKKRFPKSYISVGVDKDSRGNGKNPRLIVRCGLLAGEHEWPNGYFENDPLTFDPYITMDNSGKVIMRPLRGSSLAITPKGDDKGYLAYSRRKIPFRKTTSKSFLEAAKKLEKIFDRVKKEAKAALDNDEFSVYSEKIQKLLQKHIK